MPQPSNGIFSNFKSTLLAQCKCWEWSSASTGLRMCFGHSCMRSTCGQHIFPWLCQPGSPSILPDFSATHIPQRKSEGCQGPYKEPKRSGITDTSQKFSPSVCSHSSGARWLPMWLSQPSSSASGVPGNSHLFSYPFLAWSLTVRLYKVPSSPTPTLVKPWPTNWFQSIFKWQVSESLYILFL